MMDLFGTNAGHGHVWARPDGMKARCGGPGICAECSKYAALVSEARMTDTPPSAEQIMERFWKRDGDVLALEMIDALSDAGKIIVDKNELQDICNAIAVGDQASAWEKLTSMTKDTGSGEEQEEGFFGGKSIPPPWDTGS